MTYGVISSKRRQEIAEKVSAKGQSLLEQMLIQELGIVNRRLNDLKVEEARLIQQLQALRGGENDKT